MIRLSYKLRNFLNYQNENGPIKNSLMNHHSTGLLDRDVAVIEMALNRGIPCATVIGGGYDDDIEVLGRRHSIIHRAAVRVRVDT